MSTSEGGYLSSNLGRKCQLWSDPGITNNVFWSHADHHV